VRAAAELQGAVRRLRDVVAGARAAAAEIGAQATNRSRNSGVRRGEVEAAPYVERRGGPAGAGRLVASVDRLGIQSTSVEARFQLNDRLYVELPRGLVPRAGDRYLTYVMGDQLAGVGQVLIPTGIVRIEQITPGQPTQARVMRQFGEIRLEQRMIPFSDVILPAAGTSPIAGGTSGKVLYLHNQPVLPSIGHYVVISPTSRTGVQVGDEFSFIDSSIGRRDDIAAPPVTAGVAQVVRVTPFAATAIIVSQTRSWHLTHPLALSPNPGNSLSTTNIARSTTTRKLRVTSS